MFKEYTETQASLPNRLPTSYHYFYRYDNLFFQNLKSMNMRLDFKNFKFYFFKYFYNYNKRRANRKPFFNLILNKKFYIKSYFFKKYLNKKFPNDSY